MFLSRISSRMGLGLKLGLVAVASAGAVYAVAAYYQYRVATDLALKTAEAGAAGAARVALIHIESVMKDVESITRYLTVELEENTRPPAPKLVERLRTCIAANTNIFGAAVSYEPFAYDPARRQADFYVYRDAGGVTNVDLGDENYQYHLMDWYLLPRELERGCWSDPYYDEGGGNALMCSYAQPFYSLVDGRRVFQGVVDADISLDWLSAVARSVSFTKTGYTFIVGRNGSFIVHPNPEYVSRESLFSLAEETGDDGLRRIGKEMVNGKTALRPLVSPHLCQPVWIYYAPMRSAGWSFAVVIPEAELFADAWATARRELILDVLVLAGLFAVILLVASRMTRPLKILSERTGEMARGNLDVPLPHSASRDEVGDLARSFDRMRESLKDYIENLRQTTAARERMEGELAVARRIQMSFVPRVFPPFPDRREFDLYAALEPAREVGGDLYNYCLAEENRLHFSIGDVSDKGVPAALLMAVTQTLTRTVAQHGLSSPADILATVNRELCEENEQAMFVTMLCASLNFRTGELSLSNAGHNPPLVVRSDGAVEWVKLPRGLVLAIEPSSRYGISVLSMKPGDLLLLYTDGVTEAMNPQRETYGTHRLEQVAKTCAGATPKDVVERVVKSVRDHAADAPQSDDITILALKFLGGPG